MITAADAGFLIIALLVGTFVGWNARTARGANSDLKVHKARIPAFRRVRTRSVLTSAVLLVIALIVIHDMIR